MQSIQKSIRSLRELFFNYGCNSKEGEITVCCNSCHASKRLTSNIFGKTVALHWTTIDVMLRELN